MSFPFECPVCGHKQNMPQTNADRIRAMSDEELAEKLGGYVFCGGCPIRGDCKADIPRDEALLKWLQQPAEQPAADPDEDKQYSGLIEED